MRGPTIAIRFTKYGLRELKLYGGITGLIAAAVFVFALNLFRFHISPTLLVSLPFFVVFGLVVAFFRDPQRTPPRGENRIVAPADGMVFDIGEVDEPEFLGEKAVRIGIFLSVFDCHVNRAPCSGRVEKIIYRRGAFVSALKAGECSRRNESNFVGISDAAGRGVKVAVRQIAGQIARRIVCDLKEGESVQRGQAFGMIKFGSRCELFIPASADFKLRVRLKDMVRAGTTVIGSFEEVKAPPAEPMPAESSADAAAEPVPQQDPLVERHPDVATSRDAAESAASSDDEQVLEEVPHESASPDASPGETPAAPSGDDEQVLEELPRDECAPAPAAPSVEPADDGQILEQLPDCDADRDAKP